MLHLLNQDRVMIVDDFTGDKEREISVNAFSDLVDRAFQLIMWQLRDL